MLHFIIVIRSWGTWRGKLWFKVICLCVKDDKGRMSSLVSVVHLTHLGRKNLNWRTLTIRLACRHTSGAFSWLLIDIAVPSPLYALGPGLYKTAEHEPGRKPVSSIPPWSLPQTPALRSCPGFPQISQINSCSQVSLSQYFITETKLIRTLITIIKHSRFLAAFFFFFLYNTFIYQFSPISDKSYKNHLFLRQGFSV